MNGTYHHIPVLLKEAIEYLAVRPGGIYIDCTLGGAGYTLAIAELAGSEGMVLAIDADPIAIENAKKKIKESLPHRQAGIFSNIKLSHANFRNLSKIIKENLPDRNFKFDGIVFDLGLSSAQLEDESRGFSFKVAEARLDMAFGQTGDSLSTEEIVNSWPKDEIAKILKEYAEERFCWKIAEKIKSARKKKRIETVGDLVKVVNDAVPGFYKSGRINPATKTFQALRIATNDELRSLNEVLPQAVEALAPGGRVVVISYHSLEDRIVKNFFKSEAKPEEGKEKRLKILTKKVILPAFSEAKANPRSRSAKLRAAERL